MITLNLPYVDSNGLMLGFKTVFEAAPKDPKAIPGALVSFTTGPTSSKAMPMPEDWITPYHTDPYGVPADCIKVPLPKYTENDDVTFIKGAWVVTKNAKKLRVDAAAKLEAWETYRQAAKSALEATAPTMERITEGVALGLCVLTNADVVAFMNYRKGLRGIVMSATGDPALPLPVKPPYPVGT